MKRPLLLFSISLICGILIAHFTQSYLFIGLSFITLVLIVLVVFDIRKQKSFVMLWTILFFLIGASNYLFVYNKNINKFIEFSDKEVEIKGYIISDPQIKNSRITYVLKTEKVRLLKGDWNEIEGRIQFSTINNSDMELLEYGREVVVLGRLRLPGGRRNPGGFDFRKYLNQSGISATIFATQNNIRVGNEYKGIFIVKYGLSIRNRVLENINLSLPERQASLLNAILLGYKEGLEGDVEKIFRGAGLAHLIVVSGTHVGFIILGLVIFFKKIRIKRNLANIFIIIILVMYTVVTGFGPSVVRAVIMACIVLIGQIIKREPDSLNSIALASFLILLYNPATLFNIGFQLSFAATISIVLFYTNLKKILSFNILPQSLTNIVSLTLSAQLGVLPIVAYYFNEVSVVSIISNVLVAPVVGIITILGFMMAVLGEVHIFLSQIIGLISNTLLSFVLFVSSITSNLPFAVVRITTPMISNIILYYVLIFYFLWYKPTYKAILVFKHYVVIGVICFIIIITNNFIPKGLEVVFLDVGQGDCAFVRTVTGKTILIDGGGYSSYISESNIGDTVVIPFLLDYGVSNIDIVVATHGHNDHVQGLKPVLESFNVSHFVIPDIYFMDGLEDLLEIAHNKNISVERCKKGDIIELDSKTYFDVLHPKKGVYIDESLLNNNSLVLKLIYERVSILFTGDIEKEAEWMLINDGVDLSADILKVAHHGSISSTIPEFLERVNPIAAIISVGRNNFGHPSDEVIELLENSNIHVFRTDRDGAIILNTYGEKIRLKKIAKNLQYAN
ncbi:UNVERIFIED_CONTAM: competence protein ComEC [Acetivibrio alkalicellulosi]